MVISTIGMPPLQTLSAAVRASAEDEARTTGTIPICRMRSRTACFSMEIAFLAKKIPVSARSALRHLSSLAAHLQASPWKYLPG